MIPDRIADRYVPTTRSATGGMGSVYVCVDERLGREVAVKIMQSNLSSDPRFVERFRREARSAAGLAHPNIAKVYDYGKSEDLHYIVMELAPGIDLARLLRSEGPLEPARAVGIAKQIASALGHAHASGIVHRDIKPANVIVGADDDVKVTDFGIARSLGDATLTASGVIMGTVHYISPEQALGTKAVPASDVYSLGIVLYEMLTGSVPFVADSAVAVAMLHVDGVMPRLRLPSPTTVANLEHVVARATAKSPEERYSDGQALFAALTTGAEPGSVAPAPAPTVEMKAPRAVAVWSLARITRATGAVLAGLALLALGLTAFRAASGDRTTAVKSPGAPGAAPILESSPTPEPSPSPSPSPAPSPSPSPSPSGFIIPSEIIGDNVKDWEKRLKEEGFDVDKERVDRADFPKDAIVQVSPAPGSVLAPGDTVTLTYSSGKEPKHEEDD